MYLLAFCFPCFLVCFFSIFIGFPLKSPRPEKLAENCMQPARKVHFQKQWQQKYFKQCSLYKFGIRRRVMTVQIAVASKTFKVVKTHTLLP